MGVRFRRGVLAAALLCAAALALHAAELQTFMLDPVMLLESDLHGAGLRGPEWVHYDPLHQEVWVADTRNNRIVVFADDGMPLYAFTSSHLREPRQVVTDSRGRVLVLENDRSRIRLFNYRGVYLGDLVPPSLAQRAQIAAIAFGPDGMLYVGESASSEVFVYEYPSMTLKRRFGSRGDEEGQFLSIAAIAVDAERIYVLDHTGLAVQIFNKRGDFIRGWGRHSMGGANFSLPSGMAVDAKGRIVVVDSLRHDIKYFDLEARFIGHFGGAGRRPGAVSFPSGVAVAPDGTVYVAERGNARVQVFRERALDKPVPVP